MIVSWIQAGPIRGGVHPVHWSWAKKEPVNLWRAHSLSHRSFIFFIYFFLIFLGKFHLDFWIMFVTALYKVHAYVILTFCCTGNKAIMKVYQWFYWTSNPQYWEKFQPVTGPQSSIVPPCKIYLGGPCIHVVSTVCLNSVAKYIYLL